MTAIGVSCARVRVEEKQIIAAAGAAGFVAVPVLPASAPLPPGPASPATAMLGEHYDAATDTATVVPVQVLVDRGTNRALAAVSLPLARLNGIRTIDAGLASTGNRVQVATALDLAGIPRPATLIGFSEASAVAGAARLGHPVTLLGLLPGSSTTALHDADTAEAVIEHRVVLGEASEAIVLLQAGAPRPYQRTLVHVVGGTAVATMGAKAGPKSLALAERVANALDASLVAVELADTEDGLVVWDVHPAADFRQATPVGGISVAEAIVRIAIGGAAAESNGSSRSVSPIGARARDVEEARHGVALSA